MPADEVTSAGVSPYAWTFGAALLLAGAFLVGLAIWVLEASIPCQGECVGPFVAVVFYAFPSYYLGLCLIAPGLSLIRGLNLIASLKLWAAVLVLGTIVGIVIFVLLGSREPMLRG